MYTSVDQWMQDPDFAHHISVAPQLGLQAMPQAINSFKKQFSDTVAQWHEGHEFTPEEKKAMVKKLRISAGYVGSQGLMSMSKHMSQTLEMSDDVPLDPLLSRVSELLEKFNNIS